MRAPMTVRRHEAMISARAISYYKRHERRITSGAIILGFVIDNLTLTRVDLWFDNLVLISYLLVAALAIVAVHVRETGFFARRFFRAVRRVAPAVMQFAFGGLFSGFIVFYMRSASLSTSALFVVFLVLLLWGNEVLRKKYLRMSFQFTVFFIAIFSFFIFFVPTLLGVLGAPVFLLSGIVSLAAARAFFLLLRKIHPERVAESARLMFGGVASVFVLMNFFYVANIIPPIPLALKDAGVFHRVERIEGGAYRVVEEEKMPWEFVVPFPDVHIAPGEDVFVYSAVFAPTDLNTDILHQWQYYDAAEGKWVTTDMLRFPVFGGRDGGYRGYTTKKNLTEGRWRVNIITPRKQILGRVGFDVVFGETRGLVSREVF